MLDGILGRGFSVKCKALIKTTRARIEVVRRRAEAQQRFLKEDLVKLLSNGLDINAYGKTEEFLAGINLLSSYGFVEQCCEYIVKQLSRMQRQRECPEECREAVASLIYAAARFSDLPELRDLRDAFHQRYGVCLEAFVNQKFVEKLSSKPPANEKKLQVLQDIASEFSIKWDSSGFERRMATPSVVAQVDVQKVDTVKKTYGHSDEKTRIRSYAEGNIDERNYHTVKREEITDYREKSKLNMGDISFRGKHKSTENKHSYPIEKVDAQLKVEKSNRSTHRQVLDNNVRVEYMGSTNGIWKPGNGENKDVLFHEKAKFAPSCVEGPRKTEGVVSYNCSIQDNALNSTRKGLQEGSDRLKSCSSYPLPPPYVKAKDNIPRPPYIKPSEDKHRPSRGSIHAGSDLDEHFTDHGSGNKSNIINSSSRQPYTEPDHHDRKELFVAPAKVKSYEHLKEIDYQGDKIPLPKPRSIRKKHHRSSSNHNVVESLEDHGAVNGSSSSSRRKDHSRKGLETLFTEEPRRRDDEERMIDKLLIHYSKKPTSSSDAVKLRKKLPLHQIATDAGESSFHKSRDEDNRKLESFPPPSRSVSLPKEQAVTPEPKKGFARSNTFQPDNQAKHVHPKLPDYDDLAARFAALKGR